ncbi:MAG: ATP-binding cassette domain-containing protein [Desulfatibacillum sp.]|nr:ATP-binding cassette domain-containing protein [Desulfatibacillum sp.]
MKSHIEKFQVRNRHRKLYALLKENWGRLALAMLGMLLMAGSKGAIPLMVRPVLDYIFVNRDEKMLTLLPIAVVTLFLIQGIGRFMQEYFMSFVGQKIIKDLRDSLYHHIMELPISFFHAEKTGSLMSRITFDVNIIKTMVSSAVTAALRDFFTVIVLIGVIFYLDWKLASGAILILPFAYYPVVWFGKKVRSASTGIQEAMGDLSSFLHETFAGNKIVKAFGMEKAEKERFYNKTQSVFKLELRQALARSMSSPVMEFLAGVGIAFVIWYGGYKVIHDASYTPGTFFGFMTAVLLLYDPVKKVANLNNALQEGMAAVDRIFDIIERNPDIVDPENPVAISKKPHTLAFEHVGFKYGSTMVLQDINLEVKPGEVVALVGMSGGGKTTLVNLLPRFYDVVEGAIKIDGVDIRDVAIARLRQEIAVVTQEPILFNNSVRNNIAYGQIDATEKQIEEAAKAAYAWDFIQGFDKGLETSIGELGGRLSGGEKQRMCIARAILKDAPILILDEATSSLDTEAERVVQKALENLMQGRTCFVIAHRLSTIMHADRIAVIVGGKVVEEGAHADLLAKQGEYFKLYSMQFREDKAPEGGE